MPRTARLDFPGSLHHVMARGHRREEIFRTAEDYRDFLRRVEELVVKGKVVIYAWVLMPNHFHMLVRSTKTPLSTAMRSLMTGYAGYFNRKHDRSGHVFQNRFKSVLCDEETYFLELVRYIHLNPLRAGIVKGIKGLEEYPYSGHRVLMGRQSSDFQNVKEVWERFSRNFRKAQKEYGDFIESGAAQGKRPDLEGGGMVRSAGGWKAVSDIRRGREHFQSDERILGPGGFVEACLKDKEEEEKRRGWLRAKWTARKLGEKICEAMGVDKESLGRGGKSHRVSQVRAAVCYLWTTILGGNGRDLAREFGIKPVTIYQSIRRKKSEGKIFEEIFDRVVKM